MQQVMVGTGWTHHHLQHSLQVECKQSGWQLTSVIVTAIVAVAAAAAAVFAVSSLLLGMMMRPSNYSENLGAAIQQG